MPIEFAKDDEVFRPLYPNWSMEAVRELLIDTRHNHGCTRAMRAKLASGAPAGAGGGAQNGEHGGADGGTGEEEYGWIAKHFAVPAKAWKDLDVEKKWLAVSMAAVLSTKSAVLLGKAAALVLGIPVRPMKGDGVDLGVPSGKLPSRKDAKRISKFVRYCSDPFEPEHVRDFDGVRVIDPVGALIGIVKRHSWTDAVLAADAIKASGVTDEEFAQRCAPLKRTLRIEMERVWRFAVASPIEDPIMSEARAAFARQAQKLQVNRTADNWFNVPLVVNGNTSLRILRDGPREVSVQVPSDLPPFRDVVVGEELFRRNPGKVVEWVLRVSRGLL